MRTKTWTFEDLPAPDVELDLEYSYSYDPGCYSGAPENCWPAEEDSEIELPTGWEQVVMNRYIAAAREAIKQIESEVEGMREDGKAAEWDDDDRKDYEEDRASARYDDMMESRGRIW